MRSIQTSSDQHRWHQSQGSGTLLTWVGPYPMMPHLEGSLDNCLSKASSTFGTLSKSLAEPFAPPLHKDPELLLFPPSCTVQGPRFSTGSRSGYLSSFTKAVRAPSLASNSKTIYICIKWRNPQESQPAQHRVHLASGTVALGWPHHGTEKRWKGNIRALMDRLRVRQVPEGCGEREKWRELVVRSSAVPQWPSQVNVKEGHVTRVEDIYACPK